MAPIFWCHRILHALLSAPNSSGRPPNREERERERGKRGREREIRMLGEPVSERLSLNLECHIFGQFHSFRCLFGSWFYSWTDNEVQDSKATRHSDTRCCAANGRKKNKSRHDKHTARDASISTSSQPPLSDTSLTTFLVRSCWPRQPVTRLADGSNSVAFSSCPVREAY